MVVYQIEKHQDTVCYKCSKIDFLNIATGLHVNVAFWYISNSIPYNWKISRAPIFEDFKVFYFTMKIFKFCQS